MRFLKQIELPITVDGGTVVLDWTPPTYPTFDYTYTDELEFDLVGKYATLDFSVYDANTYATANTPDPSGTLIGYGTPLKLYYDPLIRGIRSKSFSYEAFLDVRAADGTYEALPAVDPHTKDPTLSQRATDTLYGSLVFDLRIDSRVNHVGNYNLGIVPKVPTNADGSPATPQQQIFIG